MVRSQVDDDQRYGHRLLEKLLTATGPFSGRAIGAATQHAYNYLQGAVMEGGEVIHPCVTSILGGHVEV